MRRGARRLLQSFPETLAALRREARSKGIGPTTLARMWIIERLQQTLEQR